MIRVYKTKPQKSIFSRFYVLLKCERTYKPGSVLNSHLSWSVVADGIMRPHRNGTGSSYVSLGPCFKWGLHSPYSCLYVGKLLPCLSTLTCLKAGGLFLLHYPWSRLRRPLTGTLALRSPDFPYPCRHDCPAHSLIYSITKKQFMQPILHFQLIGH